MISIRDAIDTALIAALPLAVIDGTIAAPLAV
jgi:hypothetical protein